MGFFAFISNLLRYNLFTIALGNKKVVSLIVSCFLSNILVSQNTDLDKFNNRDIQCYSIELGMLISNEGKKKNKLTNSNNLNKEVKSKYFQGVQSVINKTSKDYGNLKNWEKGKDIVLTTITEITQESIKGSSIILEPLMKYVDYEREERIKQFERESIKQVNSHLNQKFKEILDEGTSEDFGKVINGKDPIFIFKENKIEYNRNLIKLVNKRGEEERKKIWRELNTQKSKISDLYDRNAKVIKEIARVELNAIEAYERNKKAIKSNTKKIEENKQDIDENRRLLEQNSLRLSILNDVVVNHEVRISKNTDEIKTLKLSQLWDKSSLEQRIKGLKNGDFNHLFRNKEGNTDKKAISKLLGDTEKMKVRKDIYEGAKSFSEWGNVASQVFSNIDPDLSKAINTGVQVSDLVGSFASQNYSQAAMGALNLMGFGNKPKKSNETILLQKVLKELDDLRADFTKRFDSIDVKLNSVLNNQNKIQAYLEAMKEDIHIMYMENQKQLNSINRKLDFLNAKLDNIESNQSDIVLSLVNGCNLPTGQINKAIIKDYKDFKKVRRQSRCYKCAGALEDFINKGELSFNDFNQATRIKAGVEGAKVQEDIYIKILKFWKAKWERKYKDAYQSLFYPPKYTSENLKLFTRLALKRDSLNEREYKILDNDLSEPLKSPIIISRISNYFLTMYPFLETYIDGNFVDYDELLNNDIKVTDTSLYWFLNYLIEIVDYSIAQQSILSGHLMLNEFKRILYNGSYEDVVDVIEIFNNNPILLYNFTSNLLIVDKSKILEADNIVSLVSKSNLQILLHKSVKSNWTLKIKKNFDQAHVIEKSIDLKPIENHDYKPEFILTNDFSLLQKTKELLMQKRNEILFVSQISPKENPNTISQKEFKNILINNNYGKN